MRKMLLVSVMVVGAGLAPALGIAQVVSPLGGSTATPQTAPPVAPPPAATGGATAPTTTGGATAPTTAPSTTTAPGTGSGTVGRSGRTMAPSDTPPATGSEQPSTGGRRAGRMSERQRFDAANTSHDGKLTLEQARAGHMRAVVRNFDKIDAAKHGYVTLDDIRAYRAKRRAERRAQKPAN